MWLKLFVYILLVISLALSAIAVKQYVDIKNLRKQKNEISQKKDDRLQKEKILFTEGDENTFLLKLDVIMEKSPKSDVFISGGPIERVLKKKKTQEDKVSGYYTFSFIFQADLAKRDEPVHIHANSRAWIILFSVEDRRGNVVGSSSLGVENRLKPPEFKGIFKNRRGKPVRLFRIFEENFEYE